MATELEAAYAAGIVDGEGCIAVYFNKKRNVYYGYLQISNTDKNLIDWLRTTFPGNRKLYICNSKPNHKQAWIAGWGGSGAEDFLTQIYPYLIVKKEQANLFLKFRNTIYTASVEEKQELERQFRLLNKRGR